MRELLITILILMTIFLTSLYYTLKLDDYDACLRKESSIATCREYIFGELWVKEIFTDVEKQWRDVIED